jgi:hypothetical protein
VPDAVTTDAFLAAEEYLRGSVERAKAQIVAAQARIIAAEAALAKLAEARERYAVTGREAADDAAASRSSVRVGVKDAAFLLGKSEKRVYALSKEKDLGRVEDCGGTIWLDRDKVLALRHSSLSPRENRE